jgi:hypothetical protein
LAVLILTLGVTVGFTVIVTVFEVAVEVETQLKLDVITHDTVLPVANDDEE